MARTRASQSAGASSATTKKYSSKGTKASGRRTSLPPSGGSPAGAKRTKGGYGLKNHARKCATPQWQKSMATFVPGGEAILQKRKEREEEEEKQQRQEDEQPPVKKAKISQVATKSKQGQTRMKKKKDGSVKRARSAYLFYLAEKRSQVKEANPDAKFGELTKMLAEMWKNASAEEKEVSWFFYVDCFFPLNFVLIEWKSLCRSTIRWL